MESYRRFWQTRGDLIVGVFVSAFFAALAVSLAVWLVVAVALGTAELVRIID